MKILWLKLFAVLFLFNSLLLAHVELSDISAEGCSTRYVTVCVRYGDEDGYFVRDLDMDDFQFHENGEALNPPDIELLNHCPSESLMVDIVIFLDLSTSMDDEIDDLRMNIPAFVDGIGIMDYRIAIVIFNGCPEEVFDGGIREIIRTDFSDPSCAWDASGPDFWASDLDEFTCLFDAGYEEFYEALPWARGSGDEDQYGAMYEAASRLSFRTDARRVFVLFTDERPIHSGACAPSWGPGDSDLEAFIDTMNLYNIDVVPVTPEDGYFEYSSLEPIERRNYDGYYTLADSTGGQWLDLYSSDFSELVENITRAIAADSCCYQFRFMEQFYCSGTNYLDAYTDSFGIGANSYDAHCIPRNTWRIPSPECGLFSSCEYQNIALFFFEENVFGLSEIVLEVEGIEYGLSSPEIEFHGDTLVVFQPEVPWQNGQMVNFDLAYAVDDSGCYIYGEPCSVQIDIAPPVIVDNYPANGLFVNSDTTTIFFVLHDSLSGIDWGNFDRSFIELTVNGSVRDEWEHRINADTVFIEIISFDDGDSVNMEISIPDSPDYDYCPPNTGEFDLYFLVRISQPVAEIILPSPETISACIDQEIHIKIEDPDGIDWTTIELRVKDSLFLWDFPEISHNGDTLIFNPPTNFYEDNDTIDVELLRADDIFGRSLQEILQWTFYMDFSPPIAEMQEPHDGQMININNPVLMVDVVDSFSGLQEDSVWFSFEGDIYTIDDLNYVPESHRGGLFQLDLEQHDIILSAGDTVNLIVHSCDMPDTCGPNCQDAIFQFNVEPQVPCRQWPNPFTPNNDRFNDFVVFDYPHMYTEDAELKIFDKRKAIVFEKQMNNISHYFQYENRMWTGFDTKNDLTRPGLYFYMIIKDDEVICEGTITLIR
ncbi:MAG: gliding motility-associated C-terminal domain-containing protein [Candidatus Zixiibacteriota bacterium]